MEDDGFHELCGVLSCVVYALLSRGKVVYIGQSTQPLVRLFQHQLKAGERLYRRTHARGVERFPFDQVFIRSCTLAQVNQIEKDMIQKHWPKYNIAHKTEQVDFKALIQTLVPLAETQPHPYVVGKLNRRI